MESRTSRCAPVSLRCAPSLFSRLTSVQPYTLPTASPRPLRLPYPLPPPVTHPCRGAPPSPHPPILWAWPSHQRCTPYNPLPAGVDALTITEPFAKLSPVPYSEESPLQGDIDGQMPILRQGADRHAARLSRPYAPLAARATTTHLPLVGPHARGGQTPSESELGTPGWARPLRNPLGGKPAALESVTRSLRLHLPSDIRTGPEIPAGPLPPAERRGDVAPGGQRDAGESGVDVGHEFG
jgi:hypothetical protein